MARNPAFLFYPDSWIGGTHLLTRLQRGGYHDLLMEQFNDSSHSLSDQQTRSILGVDYDAVWPAISGKFVRNKEGRYFNERLNIEIDKRTAFCESRRASIAARYSKSNKLDGLRTNYIRSTCDLRMGNRKQEIGKEKEGSVRGEETNSEYRQLSELLKFRILERRQAKIEEKELRNWDRAVRLMVTRDKRNLEQIRALINEVHDMPPSASGFTWATNILSMDKLRLRWNEGKIYLGMAAGTKVGRQDFDEGPPAPKMYVLPKFTEEEMGTPEERAAAIKKIREMIIEDTKEGR